MKTLGKILALERKNKKFSQTELAENLKQYNIKVSNKTISKWEHSYSEPTANQFLALCQALDIRNINRVFLEDDTFSSEDELNALGMEKLQEYKELLLLSHLYQEQLEPVLPSPEHIISHLRKIHISNHAFSAGPGEFLDGDDFEEVEVGSEVPREADFGVRINGDSMEPLYIDQQVVWIHKQDTLHSGEIGIFYLDGYAYCKRLLQSDDGIFLESLNPKYEPIHVHTDASFYVYGKVL